MVKGTVAALDGRAGDQAGGTVDGTERPHISLPLIGTLTVPPPDRLVFYGVLGALGALGVVEWPLVLVVGIGHYLTEQRFSPLLREAGQAAETA
ncbi:hypothetical protein OG884_00425 [Streptosporangium sp. NBC_01755]|uniref:hypothetical protein n=1 Tax=Streptosporangium sp. NBC_01755 TaxID=2975949 RepID=UPI002DDB7398|nr:hypothetical protein [Streptosporangium sp. NBC_01755]WSD00445.1 hypothetical protein OG884_00425 [Streptosporangium sp. NBC_01755]